MNKQPFYHRAGILFTTVREIPSKEFKTELIKRIQDIPGIIEGTIDIDEMDADLGDPADLL